MQLQDRFYKSTEVADILGVSLRTLYRYMESGKINSVHLPSGRHRFTKAQIEEFLYSNAFDTSFDNNPGESPIRKQNVDVNYPSFQRPVKPLEQNTPYIAPRQTATSNYKNETVIPTDEELDRQLDELLKSLGDSDVETTVAKKDENPFTSFQSSPTVSQNAPYTYSEPKPAYTPVATPAPTPSASTYNNDDYLNSDDDELDKLLKSLEYEEKQEEQSKVSLNQNRPFTSLADDSFDGFRIKPQEDALDENKINYFYCPYNDLRTVAKIIKKVGDDNGLKYAFTLNAGASLYFPLDPFSIIHFYVHKNDLEIWKKELQLKESNLDDANIGVLLTKGEAFNGFNEVSGLRVASKQVLVKNLKAQNLNSLAMQVENQL